MEQHLDGIAPNRDEPQQQPPAIPLPERTHIPIEEHQAMIGKAAFLWKLLQNIHESVQHWGDAAPNVKMNTITQMAWRRLEVFTTQDGQTLQDPQSGVAFVTMPEVVAPPAGEINLYYSFYYGLRGVLENLPSGQSLPQDVLTQFLHTVALLYSCKTPDQIQQTIQNAAVPSVNGIPAPPETSTIQEVNEQAQLPTSFVAEASELCIEFAEQYMEAYQPEQWDALMAGLHRIRAHARRILNDEASREFIAQATQTSPRPTSPAQMSQQNTDAVHRLLRGTS